MRWQGKLPICELTVVTESNHSRADALCANVSTWTLWSPWLGSTLLRQLVLAKKTFLENLSTSLQTTPTVVAFLGDGEVTSTSVKRWMSTSESVHEEAVSYLRTGCYSQAARHPFLPHSVHAMRHSTPVAALVSETCFEHNRTWDLSTGS